jgi:predicted DNA-binding transcriptional regulator AlpA
MKYFLSLRRASKVNAPLISSKEIAEEFGISVQSFGGMIGNNPNSPKPVIANRTKGVSNKVQWYNAKEIRAWLAEKLGREARA